MLLVLGLVTLITSTAHAGHRYGDCKDIIEKGETLTTHAHVINASFMEGESPRPRILMCFVEGDGFTTLKVSPYALDITVYVNGVKHCPSGGYGYERYPATVTTNYYVDGSFGYVNSQGEPVPVQPGDTVWMYWDPDATESPDAGESCVRGPNDIGIPVTVLGDREVAVTVPGDREVDPPPGTLPVVTIEAGSSPVTEGDSATFTLSRTGAISSPLTVNVNVSETGTMLASNPPSSVTFGTNDTTATLTVPTQTDTTDEADSVVTATITSNAAYSPGTPSSATVTVQDDDTVPGLPVVTIAGTSPVTEGSNATFTLTRTGTGALTVFVNVSETGTMLASNPPSSVTFGTNDTTATLTVPTQTDTTDETDSVVTATITSNAAYSLGTPSSAMVTVQDDDIALPVVTIAGTSPVTEGSNATFTLRRTGTTTSSLTVTVDVRESGTMLRGNPPSSVTFGTNDSTATLTVPTQTDVIDEADSVITARITTAPAYSPGTPSSATVTVQDDDMPRVTITAGQSPVTEGTDATFTLNRTGVITAELTVRVNVGETGAMLRGTPPASVTFGANDSTVTLTVPTQADTTDEDNSVITASVTSALDASYAIGMPSSASVTVQDNDAAPGLPVVTITAGQTPVTEGTGATFTLSRTGETTTALTVTLQVSETGDMISGTPPASVTFGTNDTTVTLTVPTQADTTDEDNSVVTAQVTAGVNAAYSVGTNASASVTVEDDDLPVVSIVARQTPVYEGTDAAFTLSRAGSTTQTLVVTVQVDETGDMLRGTAPTSVTFGANAREAILTVPTQEDTVDEDNSVVTATITTAPTYSPGSRASASVTVEDDDTPGLPVVAVRAGPTPVTEGTDAVFILSRTGETTTALTVTLQVSETGDMISGAEPSGATFDTGVQRVTLAVQTEADAIDEQDSQISMRVTAGALYSVGFSATVTVRDDDGVGVRAPDGRGGSTRLTGGVNEELLPRITQAMMQSTLSAISDHLDKSVLCAGSSEAPLSEKIPSFEQALTSLSYAAQSDSLDLKHMLAGTSFFLPLNLADNGSCELALWGRGDYRNLRGGSDRPVKWDGDLVNLHLGADVWLRPNILAGLAISWSEGEFDYRGRTGTGKGDYDSEQFSVHPYISWSSPDNTLHTWASVGYGWGEIKIDAGNGWHSSDTRLWTGTVGVKGQLAAVHDVLMPGTSTLHFKGEGNISEIEAKKGRQIRSLTSDMQRLRLALEGRHISELGEDRQLIPSIELGLLHDSGDGLTGTGVEIGAGARYTDAAQGLTLEGQARVLLDHGDDYHEWSLQGEINVDPGASRRGLSFSLVPRWGVSTSKLDRLWFKEVHTGSPESKRPMTGHVDMKLDYGLPALGGLGLLTPYARISRSGESTSDFRLGSHLEVGQSMRLGIEAGRLRDTAGSSDSKIGIWSELQF